MDFINLSVPDYLESRLPGHFVEDDRGWLIGSCLWHDDGKRPNLGIYGETGYYKCLSCGAHGDLIKLVQKVEKLPTYGAAEDWLEAHYGIESDQEAVVLHLGPKEKRQPREIVWTPPSEDVFELYRHRHPYLAEERGISEEIQRMFEIGYHKHAITMPWRDRRGQLITVKFRSVIDKTFWYAPRVPPGLKGTLLYGLHLIAEIGYKTVWITEAEIDCLSLWQEGKPAVAIGGSQLSPAQAYALAVAGVSKVIKACDRDEAGAKAHRSIDRELRKYGISASESIWPKDAVILDKATGLPRPVKDVNELLLAGRIKELTHTDGSGFLSLSI